MRRTTIQRIDLELQWAYFFHRPTHCTNGQSQQKKRENVPAQKRKTSVGNHMQTSHYHARQVEFGTFDHGLGPAVCIY